MLALWKPDFRWHVGLTQCEVEEHAVLRRDTRILSGVEHEGGRGLGIDLPLVGHEFHELGIGFVAKEAASGAAVHVLLLREGHDRIAKDGEVRPAALAGDGIRRIFPAAVPMRGERGGEVATGRKAHDADALGIDAICVGVGADVLDGALCVVELRGVSIIRREPVSEDERRNPELVEELRYLLTFVIDRQSAITTSGANHHRSAIGFILIGQVGADGRLMSLILPLAPGAPSGYSAVGSGP